jgi:YggT family protein
LNPAIATIFTTFLYALVIAIVVRALLSWFPGAANNQFGRIVYRITEPLLEPVRRVMPRTGIIDLSALVVIVLLYVMISVVGQVTAD